MLNFSLSHWFRPWKGLEGSLIRKFGITFHNSLKLFKHCQPSESFHVLVLQTSLSPVWCKERLLCTLSISSSWTSCLIAPRKLWRRRSLWVRLPSMKYRQVEADKWNRSERQGELWKPYWGWSGAVESGLQLPKIINQINIWISRQSIPCHESHNFHPEDWQNQMIKSLYVAIEFCFSIHQVQLNSRMNFHWYA